MQTPRYNSSMDLYHPRPQRWPAVQFGIRTLFVAATLAVVAIVITPPVARWLFPQKHPALFGAAPMSKEEQAKFDQFMKDLEAIPNESQGNEQLRRLEDELGIKIEHRFEINPKRP